MRACNHIQRNESIKKTNQHIDNYAVDLKGGKVLLSPSVFRT